MTQKVFRYFAVVLVMVMAFSMAACGTGTSADPTAAPTTAPEATAAPTATPEPTPEPTAEPTPEPTPEPVAAYNSNTPADTLVVAIGATMNGDYINGFGNSAYDASIKDILWGYYATVYGNPAGELLNNPTVVESSESTLNEDGSKTYQFKLYDDLKWSDGTPITAKDYVFGILWEASPQWLAAGATSASGTGLVGYNAYHNGETEYFAGASLIDELTFSLTIDAAELPYFYELSYVGYGPTPLHVWAPGNDVVSDENGVKMAADIAEDCDRVAVTDGGERFAPSVTCGPYMFESFENQIVTLKKNPNFKTDYEGNTPNFEYIVQQYVAPETEVDLLLAGDVDVLPGAIEGAKIDTVKASEYGGFSSYLRNGYGLLQMPSDWGPTADVNMRWALACLINRDALLDQVLGGYGGLVNSEYGVSQWMYQEKMRELDAALQPISFNIDKANDYLDLTEWKFESDGTTPFDRTKATPEGTYMRYNSEGEMLALRHAAGDPNVGQILEMEFLKNTPLAGMQYDFENVAFDALLSQWYYGYDLPPEERIYNTFSMGTDFAFVYDPYFASMHSDYAFTDANPGCVQDEELDRLIMEMRRLESTQREEYADIWLQYQIRWNQILPAIPLYSNERFNLYNSIVKEVPTTSLAPWQYYVCQIEKNQP